MGASMRISMAARITLTMGIVVGPVLLVTNTYFAGKATPFLFSH